MKPSWLVLSSIFVASFYFTEASSVQSVSQPKSSVKKSGPSIKQHKCTNCSRRFQRKDNLTRHINSVHNKCTPFQCPKCEKTFSENSTLTRHINSVHDKQKPFECPECKKTFSENGNLIQHIKAVHNKEKPFECPECEKTFSQNSTLTRHINSVHDKQKPVQCPECKKTFSENSKLKRHIERFHDEQKPLQRTSCGKEFASPKGLAQHRPSCPKTTASPTEDNTTDLSLLGSALLSNRIDTNHFDLPPDFDNDQPATLGIDPELVVPLTLPNTQEGSLQDYD